jgi:acyl dehydratase
MFDKHGLRGGFWSIEQKFRYAESDKPAVGVIGESFDALRRPRSLRPGEDLRAWMEVLEINSSKLRPELGFLNITVTPLNQAGKAVQVYVGSLVAPCRPHA